MLWTSLSVSTCGVVSFLGGSDGALFSAAWLGDSSAGWSPMSEVLRWVVSGRSSCCLVLGSRLGLRP